MLGMEHLGNSDILTDIEIDKMLLSGKLSGK